jgi:hypothetical protein
MTTTAAPQTDARPIFYTHNDCAEERERATKWFLQTAAEGEPGVDRWVAVAAHATLEDWWGSEDGQPNRTLEHPLSPLPLGVLVYAQADGREHVIRTDLGAIVGYTYMGRRRAPAEVLAMVDSDGSAVGTLERFLDYLAPQDGINRGNEASFSSDDFPKPIYAEQVAPSDWRWMIWDFNYVHDLDAPDPAGSRIVAVNITTGPFAGVRVSIG